MLGLRGSVASALESVNAQIEGRPGLVGEGAALRFVSIGHLVLLVKDDALCFRC